LALEEKNREVIKSFIDEVFDKCNMAANDNYLTEHLTNGAGKTPESFKESLTTLFSGFPDLHISIELIPAENNFVLVFLNFPPCKVKSIYCDDFNS
jgi:predicted ester cyclase